MSTEPDVYVFTLNVTDAAGNWDTDQVSVTVLDTTEPDAYAGEDVTVQKGNEVTFDGSGSFDNIGIVLYTWSFEYDGETELLTGVEATFTFDIVGEYEVVLMVSDAAENLDGDTLIVTVIPAGEDTEPPVADAGEDQEATVGERVTFNAVGSSDDVGIVMYMWTFNYDGDTQTLDGEQVLYTFEIAGEYVVTLTVEDGSGNEDTDTMTVRVLSEGERAWRLGPFEDGDGEAVEGVKVVVYLNEQRYEATTGDEGIAVFTVAIEDLVSPGSVTATLEGWDTLEFEMTLDDNGDPEGDIPVMEQDTGEEGSNNLMYVVIAVAVVVVLLVVVFILRGRL
jgi:PKD repeat protein